MAESERYESEDVSAEPLAEPLHFEFSGITAPNRFMKAAMTERISTWDEENLGARGIPTKALINVYRKWGEGGFGVILTGNVMIDPGHLEAAGNAVIPADAAFSGERFEAFKQLAVEGKKHGSLVIAQVSHPGRQVTEKIQRHPISASDVQLELTAGGMTFAKPRAATDQDIQFVKDGFVHAAEYVYNAGYDGIELHGAHGYLLAQFLSQTTNKRTDKYGGTLENRARITTEIAQEIRKKVPKAFVMGIKINSVEFQEKGFSPEECKELCILLEANGFDFVELSGGTYQSWAFTHKKESTRKREAFFIEFADAIVPSLKRTKAYIAGGFRTAAGMTKALQTVDGVSLGRAATQEFDLPNTILSGKAKGSIKPRVNTDDSGITTLAAGAQISMVGEDEKPFDLGNPAHVEVFTKAVRTWMEQGRPVGWPRVTIPHASL